MATQQQRDWIMSAVSPTIVSEKGERVLTSDRIHIASCGKTPRTGVRFVGETTDAVLDSLHGKMVEWSTDARTVVWVGETAITWSQERNGFRAMTSAEVQSRLAPSYDRGSPTAVAA